MTASVADTIQILKKMPLHAGVEWRRWKMRLIVSITKAKELELEEME